MANGKAGDDWFTDIVGHGLPTFSPEADRLVLEVAASSAEPRPDRLISLVDGLLANIGYDALASRTSAIGMEYRNLSPGEQRALEESLRRLRADLG